MIETKGVSFAPFIFGSIALVGLVTRFLNVPWDEGGCFFQLWVSGVTLIFLAKGLPQTAPLQRLMVWCVLLPLG